MSLRALIAAGAVLLGTQSGAAPSNTAAQTVTNWDVFLKLYPRRALEAREEGLVGFIVTLDNKGDVKVPGNP